jgi:hypothetical protein
VGVEGIDAVLHRHANIGTRGIGLSELAYEPFLQDSRQESLPAAQLDLLTASAKHGLHQNSSG